MSSKHGRDTWSSNNQWTIPRRRTSDKSRDKRTTSNYSIHGGTLILLTTEYRVLYEPAMKYRHQNLRGSIKKHYNGTPKTNGTIAIATRAETRSHRRPTHFPLSTHTWSMEEKEAEEGDGGYSMEKAFGSSSLTIIFVAIFRAECFKRGSELTLQSTWDWNQKDGKINKPLRVVSRLVWAPRTTGPFSEPSHGAGLMRVHRIAIFPGLFFSEDTPA
jgi:hypothetical protein